MKITGGKIGELNSWLLVSTFFALWLAVFFENYVEDVFAYILILSFGILHGANDISLLRKSAGEKNTSRGFVRTLGYYMVFILVVAALFYLLPSIALLLFIAFSGYHFGEQHWVSKLRANGLLASVFYTVYGLFILFMLFNIHREDVSTIIYTITGVFLPQDYYNFGFIATGILTAGSFIALRKHLLSNVLLELFYLLVFFVIFSTASLLWSFAIYFILWHAIPSLADQMKFLYGDTGRKGMIRYLRSSFLYWAVSVISLFLFFYWMGEVGEAFLPFFFSFLAAITFPHVFVIGKLNRT